MSERTVVIVGAGFSGTIVAAQLLRHSSTSPSRVVLVERRAIGGKGVAYSTKYSGHLLNVPAGRMGAFPDDEGDFLRYARERDPRTMGGTFVPRMVFGEYLDATLRAAAADAFRSGGSLEEITDEVTAVDSPRTPNDASRIQVRLRSGGTLEADHVVLALGNYPPANPPLADPSFYRSTRYIADPWAPGALDNVDAAAGILLVGTGLTMLDIALQLSEGRKPARLVALSRRGLVPLPHRAHGAPPSYGHLPPGLISCEPTAVAYLRAVREHARTLERDGVDWREIMASLRPLTPRLWETLPPVERKRFLRHARPYWDTHRHRVATDVYERFEALQASGRLTLIAGRIRRYAETSNDVTAHYRPRGADRDAAVTVGTVINCTGPEGDVRHLGDPLLSSLLAAGDVRPDPMGLGLDTDADLTLLRADGTPLTGVSLVGPLLKGTFWEATAVPELRVHAARAAKAIVCRFTQGTTRTA